MTYHPDFRHALRTTEIAVLARRPLVVVAFEQVFLNRTAVFAAQAAQSPKMVVLLQVGWFHDEAYWQSFAEARAAYLRRFPDGRIIVLANTQRDVGLLNRLGAEARLCNHNAFIDERRIPVLRVPKRFDAVYLARLTPFKRFELLERAENLLLLAVPARASEKAYEESLRPILSRATHLPRFKGLFVATHLAPAACGVALSAREGAMYSAFEYSLAGLPIVNVPNEGGRDDLMPADYVRTVEATPEAVADGIRHWKAHPVNPQAVRDAALALAEPHRQRLRALMDELLAPRAYRPPFPHKLGVRVPGGRLRNSRPFVALVSGVQRLLPTLFFTREAR